MTQDELEYISFAIDAVYKSLLGHGKGTKHYLDAKSFMMVMDKIMSHLGYEKKKGSYRRKRNEEEENNRNQR